MKIKLDENMPQALAVLLRSAGHNVATVPEEGLTGADDPPVLKHATAEGRLLMTFDKDFADIRRYPIGTHAGIVVFRLRDQRWAVLQKPAQRVVESGLLNRLKQGLAIVDETHTRIHAGQTKRRQ